MSPEDRYDLLCTQYTVRGCGVAEIFTRQEDLGRLMQFMQLLQMFPQWASRVNDEAVLRKVIGALGWDADDVVLSEQEAAAKLQQLQAQQAMQMQQGAPSPGGQPMRGSAQGGIPWENPIEQRQSSPRLVGGV